MFSCISYSFFFLYIVSEIAAFWFAVFIPCTSGRHSHSCSFHQSLDLSLPLHKNQQILHLLSKSSISTTDIGHHRVIWSWSSLHTTCVRLIVKKKTRKVINAELSVNKLWPFLFQFLLFVRTRSSFRVLCW